MVDLQQQNQLKLIYKTLKITRKDGFEDLFGVMQLEVIHLQNKKWSAQIPSMDSTDQ